MCSTHVKGTPLKIERPPVWAFWAHPARSLPGAPERAGWMGTDRNGYDIFSRAVFGARVSLVIGALAITFGLLIGGLLGLISGYRRGTVDRVTENAMNIMLAFPALLLAIFVVSFFNTPELDRAGDVAPDLADHPRALVAVDPAPHPARAGQHHRLRAARVRARGPQRRGQGPPDHLPRDPAQRRAVDDLVRAHRPGPADRGRGRARLPRALGRGAHPHLGEDDLRRQGPPPGGLVDLADAGRWCCSSPSSPSTSSATCWPSSSTSARPSDERAERDPSGRRAGER